MKKSFVKKRSENAINRYIEQVIAKVNEMCDYAIENLCVQPAQFEELEMMLLKHMK